MNKSIISLLAISLSACASLPSNSAWNTTDYYDEFTDEKYCRVQPYMPRMLYYDMVSHNYVFFAENKDGEIRVGFRSNRNFPIVGDFQIKIGTKLVLMTAEDTPIDSITKNVQLDDKLLMAETINKITENVSKLGSPYRAFEGEKAKQFLRDIIAYDDEIKYRTVSTNKALSTTGIVKINPSFKEALETCNITLESK